MLDDFMKAMFPTHSPEPDNADCARHTSVICDLVSSILRNTAVDLQMKRRLVINAGNLTASPVRLAELTRSLHAVVREKAELRELLGDPFATSLTKIARGTWEALRSRGLQRNFGAVLSALGLKEVGSAALKMAEDPCLPEGLRNNFASVGNSLQGIWPWCVNCAASVPMATQGDRRQHNRVKQDGIIRVETTTGDVREGNLLDFSHAGMCLTAQGPLALLSVVRVSLWIYPWLPPVELRECTVVRHWTPSSPPRSDLPPQHWLALGFTPQQDLRPLLASHADFPAS